MQSEVDFSNCICLIAIGMSGTGKTTFVNKYKEKMNTQNNKIHCINLDPAVKKINYEAFLDIRQTHDYRKVMKEYKLGPNGAILTALNLFTAQPQQIVKKIQQKVKENPQKRNIFLIDIPGQIQVFTWSASSLILTEAVATMMPVKLLYIIDSVRCQNPNVFLSNLLFAQSIQCRLAKFDFLLLLNKTDCVDGEILRTWMTDYQEFMTELHKDQTYMSTLSKSIVIHLSDFYQQMNVMLISAKTGKGFEELQKEILPKINPEKAEKSEMKAEEAIAIQK